MKEPIGQIKLPNGDFNIHSELFGGDVDVDDLTSIHYENIEGEILTVSADLNKVGIIRAQAERLAKKSKLGQEIYAAKFIKNLRREASMNSNHFTIGGDRIKLTEGSLKDALMMDRQYQALCTVRIDDEANFEMMDSVYWGIKEKAKKLDKLSFKDSRD